MSTELRLKITLKKSLEKLLGKVVLRLNLFHVKKRRKYNYVLEVYTNKILLVKYALIKVTATNILQHFEKLKIEIYLQLFQCTWNIKL